MTSKSESGLDPHSSDQQLRAENAALRAELKKVQAALKFQKLRRREISKLLNVGFWEWDEKTDRPISFSPEMADVLGIDSKRLENLFHNPQAYKEILHPEDLQHYEEHLDSRSILKPGQPHIYEYRVIVEENETRYIREYELGVFDDQENLLSSFGLIQDVTATRTAVDALKESEERYHSLFEQMPLGVQEEDYSVLKQAVDKLLAKGLPDIEAYFQANPNVLRGLVAKTRITSVNETLLRMHHADNREQFVATEAGLDDWWDENWVKYYAAEIAALASDRGVYEAERVDSRTDGTLFETRSLVTLVRGYEDSWERVITIHEDITGRRKTESALREAVMQAEQANEAKSHFLSSMSHELRTPLNAILGFSQLFAYDRELSVEHLVNANEINRAGKHLMSLIDQILDLSRIEAGESDVSLEPVKLKRVLSDSVKWAMPMAQGREVQIDFDAELFEGLIVVADLIRLKQVFLNLLTNAVKYNRVGGRVSVIRDDSGDGLLRIGVRDTGVGISEEKQKELFQPFNRLGAEFSGIEGSGIGLVIARELIDLMNGTLEIESEVDVGSTFWVSLQLAPALASVMDTQTMELPILSDALVQGGKSRILVAEDNLVNQELIAAQLKLLGYQADYVENGVQALQDWQSGDYGLLLTDIRMPEMSGYDLVREIRQREQAGSGRASVIAITANALDDDVKQCYEAGVDEVIAKPVELEDLRSALDQWAPQNSARAAAPKRGAARASASTETIDFSVLQQAIGDKPRVQCELLKSYLDVLDEEIEHIRQAFSWKNTEQVGAYCHKLKSSSRSLGVIVVAEICERLEAAAKQGELSKLEEEMPLLQQQTAAARRAIEVFLVERAGALSRAKTAITCDIELVGNLDPDGLPAQAEQAPIIDTAPADDDIEVTQFTINLMLVDDDYIMHRVTTVMLNDLGLSNVVNAMSGPDALEMLRGQDESIDVIICDLNMPQMDGVEFIRHLAQQKYTGSLILTSGEDMRILKTVEKLAIEHELHVLGSFEKPVTPTKIGELLDLLHQVQQEGTMNLPDSITLPELEKAINNGEIDTYFQPKVEIATGRVVGVEALARWVHPVKGLIMPGVFIALAEENNLIGALTEAVCVKALEYAARLKAMEYDLNVAINLSVDSLTDLGWPEKITTTLQEYGLEPSSISFEITESRLMENASVALDILSRLSLKRFNLSIDDFGTGYSSMEQLQRIPFSEFKIDRAFVHGAAREASAQAILESSVVLAKKLDMKVVAEGVEDQQDWDLVARIGCDQVQGYFVSRPMPFNQLAKWIKNSKTHKKFTPRT